MTGPLFLTLHPHRRPGRRLLSFLIAMALAPVACTSDQPTEPMSSPQEPVAASTGTHPRPLLNGERMASLLAGFSRTTKPRANFRLGVASTVSGASPSVLVLADADVGTTAALADTLTDAGFQVTVRPAPEWSWDGTNPALDGFDLVIHLNGAGYDGVLGDAAQQALSTFVQNGGGYIGAQWNSGEYIPAMADLVLQTKAVEPDGSEQNCALCQVSYHAAAGQESHPVLAGLAGGFTFTADGHDAATQVTSGSTVLMQVSSDAPGVLVREFGNGKVVNFSFAPNYPLDDGGFLREPVTLNDSHIKRLYINAARWVAGTAAGAAEPQTITFGPLSGKVYGDPAFSISAAASSDLPVSFTAAGDCGVLGTTVTITAAGACTITAHQAGNDAYAPAENVSQAFAIAKALPTITWAPAPLSSGTPLGPSQLNATASGLGGTPLAGNSVYNPAAGTSFNTGGTYPLWVQFTPSDPNYAVAEKTITITVSGAMRFTGFFAPIRNLPYVNTTIAGSSIPVKFSLGAYRGLGVLQAGSPTSSPVACDTSAPVNVVRPGIASTSGLQSVGYGYTYVWKTNPTWAGTCRKFVLTLSDGSAHEALFRFTAPAPAPATTTSTARRIIGG